MKKICLFISFVCLCLCVNAQNSDESTKVWNLEDCINHAVTHNLKIRQLEIQTEDAKIKVNTAHMSRLPNLNASAGQSLNFGRGQTSSGLFESQTLGNSNFNISSSIPIFTGFQIPNEISKAKLDMKAATQQLEKAKEDLAINIASFYLQVLFNKEILRITEEQQSLSKSQVERTKTLVDVGKVANSQLFDLQAQVAKDEVSVIQAKNTLKLSLLDLAQNLELEQAISFDIESPAVDDVIEKYMGSIQDPETIYSNSVNIKPMVKEQELRLESAKKSLRIAQSGYYPRLSLSMSYGNGYYYDYTKEGNLIEDKEDPSKNYIWHNKSFSKQIKDNASEYIGISLSIPIFNRFQTRNQVKSSRLNINSQQFELDNTKKTLYKEIQTAYLNATAAQEKYRASEQASIASSESFKHARERYEIGKISVFEFNEARTKLIQSQSEQIQAKYDYIFRTKILDFYNGIAIKL